MDLSIIIVNWKVKELVLQLLASIFANTKRISFEVFVIDNDSRDGSMELFKQQFPNVTVIANQKNLGFAGGCNQGIKLSRGAFVVLLNPDTELVDDSLDRLVDWMRAHTEAGIASGKVLNTNRTIQRTIRHFPSISSQTMILFKLHHIFPKSNTVRSYFWTDFDYEKEQEVDQVIGAFFCIRRSVIEKIGIFDEEFFLWYEEVDFCKRAKEQGFKIIYTPVISIIHHGGESFGKVFAFKKQQYLNNSLKVYARKHFGKRGYLWFRIISPISLFLAWMVQLVHIKPTAYRRIV